MFKKIAIVGLGLMGGSLAAACRKKFPGATITGVTRNRRALNEAFRKRWIDQATQYLEIGVKDADLIVLCTPVDVFPGYLKVIDRVCKHGALVTDVGSAKGLIQKAVNRRRWRNLSFVSCHPMVGSHKRGIEAVNPALYDGGLMILIRDKKTSPSSLEKVKRFWSAFSKRIVELTPEAHDAWVGEVSHLPHVLAVCLTQTVSRAALKLASSGFRDTTRIAASDPSIWQPIFKANKKYVLNGIAAFEKELKTFKRILRASDPESLKRYLDRAQQKRNAL